MPGDPGDFFRPHIQLLSIKPAKISGVDDELIVVAMIVNQPVYVEVLNGTHNHLDRLKGYELLAVLVTANDLPEVGESGPIHVAPISLDEAQQ